MYNITVVYFLVKASRPLQGIGEWRGISYRPDDFSGDLMTPNFTLNYRFFRINMVTSVTIEKELNSFCVAYLMDDEGTLDFFSNIIQLDFYLSWYLVDSTFTDD